MYAAREPKAPAGSELKTPTEPDLDQPTAVGANTAAQPGELRSPQKMPLGIIDLRIGWLFPSLFNKLNTTYTVHAGLAWQFAFARALGAFLDLSYCEPTATGVRTDPRIAPNGGEERWNLAVRDFGFAIGPRFGFDLGKLFNGHVGAGASLSITRSVTTATAGATALGTSTEYSTRF